VKTGTVSEKIKNILYLLIHLGEISIFQKICLICSSSLFKPSERYLCEKCKEKIEKRNLQICKVCGLEICNEKSVCGECTISHPPYKRHIAFSVYKDDIRKLILLYKLSMIEPLKYYIARLYINIIDRYIGENYDLIIPVPSDPKRRKDFEPVLEIAMLIAEFSGKKISKSNLIKIKSTDKQSSLNYKKRIRNLTGAFIIRDPEELEGQRVLLIDDVYTTGTTIKRCSVLLRKHADEVYAVSLARSSNINLDQ